MFKGTDKSIPVEKRLQRHIYTRTDACRKKRKIGNRNKRGKYKTKRKALHQLIVVGYHKPRSVINSVQYLQYIKIQILFDTANVLE